VLNFLADNLAIVTLMGLTLVVLALLALVIWASIVRERDRSDPAKAQAPQLAFDTIRQSFRSAVELIEQNIASRSERYNVPWALVVNEPVTSGRTDEASVAATSSMLPLVSSGLSSALSTDASMSTASLGIEWNFFDQGIALQLRGEFLGELDKPDSPQRSWDDLLGLCRKYRPDRPFDALVFTVPAQLLLSDSADGLAEITQRARSLHRRLWLAQNRFALRFPVYLVIAGAEKIPGFQSFAQGLPDGLRGSMLGWSNAHELSAPYQPGWADTALDTVIGALASACEELSALEPAGEDSSGYFTLPAEIDRLRQGLRVFLDEFMRPSAYHEPFMLRGLYLTGNAAEGELVQPAFLRDIFERKVFQEVGLVRAAAVQRTRRPALKKSLQYATAGVLGIWAIGLLWTTQRLDGAARELSSAIARMDRDTVEALQSTKMNAVNFERSRARALDALRLVAQVDVESLGSVFMPGSWRWFDDLGERVEKRLEQRFAENAFIPIRRSLYSLVSELSGVTTDPASGELIQGAHCTLPSTWKNVPANSGLAPSIAVDDQPELKAILAFLARAENIERVLAARQRLIDGRDAPSASDLKVIVNVALGADLSANIERAAELFRRYAKALPPMKLDPMRDAMSCSFGLAMDALHRRLFQDNPLLKSEQRLAAKFEDIFEAGGPASEPSKVRGVLKSVLDELNLQEALMQPGKGEWMQSETLMLGSAHDALLQRAASMSLFDRAAVDRIRSGLQQQYLEFRTTWLEASEHEEVWSAGELIWVDKDARWAFSAERSSLRQALSTLMAQSYMQPLGRRTLPTSTTENAYLWDLHRLEQAVGLAEVRRRYESEVLVKFPEALRPEIDRVARAALAETLVDMTVRALVPVPVSTASIGEPERALIGRIRVQLMDLGATEAANKLTGLLSRDVLARLRLVDDAWASAEPFALSARGFDGWNGDRPPLLEALGLEDPTALTSYIEQQNRRILQLAKEAEGIISGLDAASKGGAQSPWASDPLVQKWRLIVADVERHRNRSAASSLTQLEQFATTVVADVNLNNCGEKLFARPATVRANDPFQERYRRLHRDLVQRCRSLRTAELKTVWSSFRDHYNRDIAGRSPFALLQGEGNVRGAWVKTNLSFSGSGGGSLNRSPLNPDQVFSTLRTFDRISILMKDRLMYVGGRHVAGAAMQRFTAQLDEMQKFMSPLTAVEDEATSGFDIKFELRSNQSNEIEGNKFIDWIIIVGNQRQGLRDPVKPMRWSPGDPIELSIRAATDGPLIPIFDPKLPGMGVDNMVVRFSFTDPWALLSMLQQYRDLDYRSSDQRVSMLKLEFPVQKRAVAGPSDSSLGKARLYVRLTISPPGKRASLAWPVNIPASAPKWGAP
jgi:type VI secretion system protein ImpL